MAVGDGMTRFLLYLVVCATICAVWALGYGWISLGFAALALVILALAEIDQYLDGHRGVSGSFKRTDKLAKR